jgi:hypothetical protein
MNFNDGLMVGRDEGTPSLTPALSPRRGGIGWNAAALFLTCVGIGWLAGCASHQEKIVFQDEPSVAAKQPAETIAAEPPVQKLSKADELLVKAAIYGYLLQRDFWATHEYTAVFLQGDDAEVAALQKQFPRHDPPIKSSDRALLQPNRTPVDKDTGRPAMILSIETLDPEGDAVEAIGRWYAGGAMAGFYRFELKKIGSEWVIQSVK